MSEWKEYSFSSFVDISPLEKLVNSEIYPYIEMADLAENSKYCKSKQFRKFTGSGTRFQNKDTLFARITPCLENGKICQVNNLSNNKGFGSTEFHVFRGKEGISSTDFIFYLSRWNEVRDFAESNFHGTSGRQRVPREAFDNLILLLPPLPEQRAIAGVLSSFDDKIDLLHRQNKTLESLAETIWRKMFVEDAKPEWRKGYIKDLFLLHRGYDLPEQNRIDGKFPVISASGITGYHSEYKIESTGVITGRSGLLGNVYFINENFWPLNTSLYVSEFRLGTPLFSYFVLKSLDLENFNGGSAVPTLNRNDVHLLETTLPSSTTIQLFENIGMSFFSKINSNNTYIESLSNLRNSLLPKLMTGKIRVKL